MSLRVGHAAVPVLLYWYNYYRKMLLTLVRSRPMKQTLVGMNSHFRAFLREESGQDLIEYALVAALIAFGSVAAMQTLAANIATGFSNVGTKMTTYTS